MHDGTWVTRVCFHYSRPGDTIWLAPHQEHHVENVRVDVPVHLRGGGAHPEDTVLICPKGAVSGLQFRYDGCPLLPVCGAFWYQCLAGISSQAARARGLSFVLP